MVPTFLHIMTDGSVWISSQFGDTPAGTVAGVFRINGASALTKITTISGTNPYAVTGATGKLGKELGGR
jgi:hypothetical protein